MKRLSFSQEELIQAISISKNVWEVAEKLKCSKNSIIKYMKLWNVTIPDNFYNKGGKVGCPKGTPKTDNWRKAMTEKLSGENNHWFGKKLPEQIRRKMSENHADFSGDKNPLKKALKNNPELHQKLSQTAKDRWKNYSKEKLKQIKTNFSLAQCNNEYHKNNSSFKNHKHGHYESIKGGKHYYRSSWELQVAQALDNNKYVKSYEYEKIKIQYYNKDGETRYSKPDFLVTLINNHKCLLEIKPLTLINHNNNQFKIKGYINYCKENNFTYIQIGKDELSKIDEIIQNLVLNQ